MSLLEACWAGGNADDPLNLQLNQLAATKCEDREEIPLWIRVSDLFRSEVCYRVGVFHMCANIVCSDGGDCVFGVVRKDGYCRQ
jgi:hypothetical protein